MEARGEERFGPWRLGRRIAAGSLAEVAEARRVGLGSDGPATRIALKRLHGHVARDPDVAALFAAECALTTRGVGSHPHLVRGLEIGEVEGRPFLAMALVAGADLRRVLESGAVPSLAATVQIVLDLCAALDHLHRAGWVHGDVNPTNLVVDGTTGTVVVCDLGVARPRGDAGPVRGTHAYMAPEQIRGEIWTPATDVFAAGVVLWELVARSRLFFRGPTWLTMAAVMDHDPAPLADPGLDALARAALGKVPGARLESVAEVAAGLAELASARGWEPAEARAELAELAAGTR